MNEAEYGFLSSVYEIITDIEYGNKAKSFSAIYVLKCLLENYWTIFKELFWKTEGYRGLNYIYEFCSSCIIP